MNWFAIGIVNGKSPANIGTLWRHACLYGAAFVYTVGERYKRQTSDTQKAENKLPILHFKTVFDLLHSLPPQCQLVGVELTEGAKPLPFLTHTDNMCFILGAEDHGLPDDVLTLCHRKVVIPCPSNASMNVAVAGTLVMYDRYLKRAWSKVNAAA